MPNMAIGLILLCALRVDLTPIPVLDAADLLFVIKHTALLRATTAEMLVGAVLGSQDGTHQRFALHAHFLATFLVEPEATVAVA